jgi:hypothetical protein
MSLERAIKEEEALEREFYGNSSEDLDPELGTPDFEEGSTPSAEEVHKEEEVDKKTRQSWKTRFTNYKASTDRTISNLRKENQNLIAQLESARTKIDDLSNKVATAYKQSEDIFNGIVSPEEIDLIGPEAVDVVKKATKKATDSAIAPLREELDRLKAKELERQKKAIDDKVQSNYKNFLSRLKDQVPDYSTIDKDPKFSEFMASEDPVTGEKRIDQFRRAEDYLDADRVAEFFMEYKDSLPRSKKDVLEEHITPDGNRSGGTPLNSPEKTSFSVAEVNKFFSDFSKGVYKNRPKEAEDIEARITKAYMNGKIL